MMQAHARGVSAMTDRMQMTLRGREFFAALDALCQQYQVRLMMSGYDHMQIWDVEAETSPGFDWNDADDCTHREE
jgi:hypothetical protein